MAAAQTPHEFVEAFLATTDQSLGGTPEFAELATPLPQAPSDLPSEDIPSGELRTEAAALDDVSTTRTVGRHRPSLLTVVFGVTAAALAVAFVAVLVELKRPVAVSVRPPDVTVVTTERSQEGRTPKRRDRRARSRRDKPAEVDGAGSQARLPRPIQRPAPAAPQAPAAGSSTGIDAQPAPAASGPARTNDPTAEFLP